MVLILTSSGVAVEKREPPSRHGPPSSTEAAPAATERSISRWEIQEFFQRQYQELVPTLTTNKLALRRVCSCFLNYFRCSGRRWHLPQTVVSPLESLLEFPLESLLEFHFLQVPLRPLVDPLNLPVH